MFSSSSRRPYSAQPVHSFFAPTTTTSQQYVVQDSSRPRLQHKSYSIHTSIPTMSRHSLTRPLPPIPIIPSAPISSTPSTLTRSLRPLPRPPVVFASSEPYLPTVAESPPKQKKSNLHLMMKISPYSDVSSASTESSPLSPLTPLPLSPDTAKRRSAAKLRRQLGESLPQDLVYGMRDNRRFTLKMLGKETRELFVECESESSSDEEDSDVSEQGKQITVSLNHQDSRKWVREKGGRRWTEDNMDDVLRSLRKL